MKTNDRLIKMINEAVDAGDIPGLTFLLSNEDVNLTIEHLKTAIKNDDLSMTIFLLDNDVRALRDPNKSHFDKSFEAIELAYRLGRTDILQALEDKAIERGYTDLTNIDFTTPSRITDEIYERVRVKLISENNNINVETKITELLINYLNL